MASGKSPWVYRHIFYKLTPFLFSECPGYNKHWRWGHYCCCISGENGALFAIKRRGEWLTVKGQGVEWQPRAPWQQDREG